MLKVDNDRQRLDLTQKTEEEREMDQRISAGAISARGPAPTKAQAAASGSFASAFARAGLVVPLPSTCC